MPNLHHKKQGETLRDWSSREDPDQENLGNIEELDKLLQADQDKDFA